MPWVARSRCWSGLSVSLSLRKSFHDRAELQVLRWCLDPRGTGGDDGHGGAARLRALRGFGYLAEGLG